MAIMNTYDISVRRDGRLWFIGIPEINGATRARSLGEVEPMARDYIAAVRGIPESSFTLVTTIHLPDEVTAHLTAAEQARAQETQARSTAAFEWAAAAKALRDAGLTVREIGATLKISHQRAAQLVNS
jgi:hypothetical protein